MKVQQLLDQAARVSCSQADIQSLQQALSDAFSETKSLAGLQARAQFAGLDALPSYVPRQERFTEHRRIPLPVRRPQAMVKFERPLGARFWTSIVLWLQAGQLSIEVSTCMQHEQVCGNDVPVTPSAQQPLHTLPTDTVAAVARSIAKVAIAQHVDLLQQMDVPKDMATQIACDAWRKATEGQATKASPVEVEVAPL